jgi:hypothetical protein
LVDFILTEKERGMNSKQLRGELRQNVSANLRRRRAIAVSLAGRASMSAVSLYQTGIIPHLPDPPLPGFNSSKVDASDYACRRFSTPDGVMMLTNYGITAWLAAAGGQNRARKQPILPIAMALKILGDAAVAVELAREEWNENKAFCAYCQVATLCSLVSVALAAPEALTALGTLRGAAGSTHTWTRSSRGAPPNRVRVSETATTGYATPFAVVVTSGKASYSQPSACMATRNAAIAG